MWVRTQNKRRLLEVKDFAIVDTNVEAVFRNYSSITLGRYSNEEKALEVLNDLQEMIDQQEEFKAQGEDRHNNTSYRRMIKFVFQMPTDEEVKGGEKGDQESKRD